jgi:hypothetical protein
MIHKKRKVEMKPQTQSKLSAQTRNGKFLFALTICAWIVAAALSIYFYLTMRTDLSGSEWLGSPLFGLPLVAVLMTAYYFAARDKSIQPAVHGVAWAFILLVVTTANMLSLAHFVFGEWRSFQYMPIMGAFQLILVALGVHISLKEKSRGALYLFLTWTIVLSLLTASTFAFMTIAFHSDFGKVDLVAGLGLSVWIGLMLMATFGFRSRFATWLDALVGWAWCMVIGNSVSMVVAVFVLHKLGQMWTLYSLVGTFSFAVLVTALRITTRDRRQERVLTHNIG